VKRAIHPISAIQPIILRFDSAMEFRYETTRHIEHSRSASRPLKITAVRVDQGEVGGRCLRLRHSFSSNSTRMAKKNSAKATSLYGTWSIQSRTRQEPSK
jgi:hypothetical protein